jgi:hypothetical protein
MMFAMPAFEWIGASQRKEAPCQFSTSVILRPQTRPRRIARPPGTESIARQQEYERVPHPSRVCRNARLRVGGHTLDLPEAREREET